MSVLQYDLFLTQEQSEIDDLRFKYNQVKNSSDKVRRKVFAEVGEYKKVVSLLRDENSELKKIVFELQERVNFMERGLCYGK